MAGSTYARVSASATRRCGDLDYDMASEAGSTCAHVLVNVLVQVLPEDCHRGLDFDLHRRQFRPVPMH